MKERGDCFGEISLMYDCPRNATVAATVDAVVWVMDRTVFRWDMQHTPKAHPHSMIPGSLRMAGILFASSKRLRSPRWNFFSTRYPSLHPFLEMNASGLLMLSRRLFFLKEARCDMNSMST